MERVSGFSQYLKEIAEKASDDDAYSQQVESQALMFIKGASIRNPKIATALSESRAIQQEFCGADDFESFKQVLKRVLNDGERLADTVLLMKVTLSEEIPGNSAGINGCMETSTELGTFLLDARSRALQFIDSVERENGTI